MTVRKKVQNLQNSIEFLKCNFCGAANPKRILVTTFWFMERMAMRMMLLKTRVRMEMVERTRILVHCNGWSSGQQG